jgi:uncharacterized protein YuzE
MNPPLELRIDFEAGAGYVEYRRLKRGQRVARTERLSDDVFVDYNASSDVLGIEVLAFDAAALGVAKRFARTHKLEFPPRLASVVRS